MEEGEKRLKTTFKQFHSFVRDEESRNESEVSTDE